MPIRPEHRKTFPTGRIGQTLLMFIGARAGEHGTMNAAHAYLPLADYYDLSPEARALQRSAYFTNDKKPGAAWDAEVQEAVKALKRDGYLTSSVRGGQTVWRLTPSGVDRANFWITRMTEKTAALKALAADPQLVTVDAEDRTKEVA